MEIVTALIAGDPAGTSIYAQSFDAANSLTFRFSYNSSRPISMSSRIVSCYHGIDDCHSMDRSKMREFIQTMISTVWPACSSHPAVNLPDVIIQMDAETEEHVNWTIHHERSYPQYLETLKPITSNPTILTATPDHIPLETLRFTYFLGGRGETRLASLGDKLYVYKGLSFRLYLELGKEYENERGAFYDELETISALPKHPNILPPPTLYVTASLPSTKSPNEKQHYLCGYLHPYQSSGSLQEVIDKSCGTARLPLKKKAKWAHQITSAMKTIHTAGQYHMDLKPANILVNAADDIVVIDWENNGASSFFVAPEADGTWEIQQTAYEAAPSSIRYQRYIGPPRQNNCAWPTWNVFPIWHKCYPKALEAAEIFSLGRTLWVLFEEINAEDIEDDRDEPSPLPVKWTAKSDDIPQTWKHLVMCCLKTDPNKRISFAEAQELWEQEMICL